ncbi:membrane protein [Synergistales bacterium]|nr:membrane protein [Synergistales bacterium]
MEYQWLLYALLSAAAASLVAIFGKIGLRGIDANAATAVRSVIMAVFLIGVVTMRGGLRHVQEVLTDKHALLFVCMSGIAGALSWLFYFLALRYGEVAKVAPIDKLSVVFACVMAVFILGEKISPMGIMGVALIAVGAVMVALA